MIDAGHQQVDLPLIALEQGIDGELDAIGRRAVGGLYLRLLQPLARICYARQVHRLVDGYACRRPAARTLRRDYIHAPERQHQSRQGADAFCSPSVVVGYQNIHCDCYVCVITVTPA